MYNRRYDKKFFMLRQEQMGYSMGQKTPWGSCILEIKNNTGVLTVRVQSLKRLNALSNGKCFYDVYIVANKKDTVFCNEIYIDNNGNGDLIWEFEPDFIKTNLKNTESEKNNKNSNIKNINSIKSKFISIEDVDAILIVHSNDKGDFAPLIAYIDERVNWKKFFVPVEKTDLSCVEEVEENKNENETRDSVEVFEIEDKKIDEVDKSLNTTDYNSYRNIFDENGDIKNISKCSNWKKVCINSDNKDVEKNQNDNENINKNVDEVEAEAEVKKDTIIHVAENAVMEKEKTVADKPKIFNFNFGNSKNKENVSNEDENCHGNFSALMKKFRKELKELSDEGIFTKEDLQKIHNAGENEFHKLSVEYSEEDDDRHQEHYYSEKNDKRFSDDNELEYIVKGYNTEDYYSYKDDEKTVINKGNKRYYNTKKIDLSEEKNNNKMEAQMKKIDLKKEEVEIEKEREKLEEKAIGKEQGKIKEEKEVYDRDYKSFKKRYSNNLSTEKNQGENKEKKDCFDGVNQRMRDLYLGKEIRGKRFSNEPIEYNKVAPFVDKNDEWDCITLDEMVLVPSFPMDWQRKFFFLYPMKQYSHFLHKKADGVDYLAVPSHKKYVEDDREEALELGFMEFLQIENSDFGYWICEKNSCVN